MKPDLHAIADEAFAAIASGRQISPFSLRPAGLTLEDAYV
jgi:2-keto-4-pentenoate hydratase